MFPPAEDAPDLGIPPNRGPLPVRTNPNSEPNTRVRSAIDAMPGRRGFGGPELTEALLRFLTCSFIFSALFIVVLMITQNKICVTEQEWSFLGVTKFGVTEQEWSFLDGIKSGTSLKFG
ncbi:hypothetical protein CK203_067090 [Vitis vinifera]|uniref:Uncharacterized protein n=1 Tax=Vitis vinifera TaxID=29760 RepID=A0A438F533_VITVI|nr:hypothetical protein CK203_067090 [Vitis vinifera]